MKYWTEDGNTATKWEGELFSPFMGKSLAKGKGFLSHRIPIFLGLPQGPPQTCRTGYWIIYTRASHTSQLVDPLVQESGVVCFLMFFVPSLPTATHPNWGKGKGTCLMRVLRDKSVEGPSYFRIATSIEKKRNRMLCPENDKNQFCWGLRCRGKKDRKVNIKPVNKKEKTY